MRTCCRRFAVGIDRAAERGIGLYVEGQAARLRLVAEGPRDCFEQRRYVDVFGFDGDRARFDFRQIENVADQIEQIGAGTVDCAGKLDLLLRKIAVGVLGQLLTENEDAIQRRAQLVRHVGQEFGFVLGRK